jgi:hypothetical protein
MSDTPSKTPNRSCRYCKAKFKPVREDQRFCKPAHRKSFWKYGGLPFDKMKEQIMKDVRKMVREIVPEEIDRRAGLVTVSTTYAKH